MTIERYLELRLQLAASSKEFFDEYKWSQSLKAPTTPGELVCEYTWVVLNSGMKNTVARKIMDRVWPLLTADQPIGSVFRHPGKVAAIERVWAHRADYFTCFRVATDIIGWCDSLPWIGPITKYHLAKNLGADVAKPDRWLQRVADAGGETVTALCERLATATGDRIATVDVVLWRACVVGLLTPGS